MLAPHLCALQGLNVGYGMLRPHDTRFPPRACLGSWLLAALSPQLAEGSNRIAHRTENDADYPRRSPHDGCRRRHDVRARTGGRRRRCDQVPAHKTLGQTASPNQTEIEPCLIVMNSRGASLAGTTLTLTGVLRHSPRGRG
jgi:hypothetical protein